MSNPFCSAITLLLLTTVPISQSGRSSGTSKAEHGSTTKLDINRKISACSYEFVAYKVLFKNDQPFPVPSDTFFVTAQAPNHFSIVTKPGGPSQVIDPKDHTIHFTTSGDKWTCDGKKYTVLSRPVFKQFSNQEIPKDFLTLYPETDLQRGNVTENSCLDFILDSAGRKGYRIVPSTDAKSITMRKETVINDFTLRRDFIFSKSTGHLIATYLRLRQKGKKWSEDSHIEFMNWNLSPTIDSDAFSLQIPVGWTESPHPIY